LLATGALPVPRRLLLLRRWVGKLRASPLSPNSALQWQCHGAAAAALMAVTRGMRVASQGRVQENGSKSDHWTRPIAHLKFIQWVKVVEVRMRMYPLPLFC